MDFPVNHLPLPQPAGQDCQGLLHPEAIRGLHLFNERQYWKAHEALEAAWLGEPGQVRHMYRGILQIGVAYLHVQRSNYLGVLKVYGRSRRWLEPFPAICRGVNLGQLRQDADWVISQVLQLGPDHLVDFNFSLLKPIQWS